MSELFLTVLNMSFTASYVILFVIIVRLLLKKAPKFISYALWSVVAFRLVIPFSFESMFSLMPRNTNAVPIPHDIIYQQSPKINSGIKAVDSFVNNSLPAPAIEASVNPLQIYVEIGAYIWLLGIAALLVYSFVSVLLLKRQLKGAQLIEKNIFEAKNLKTPFVLGLINPNIYLPVGLSKEEQNYILIHEQTHIHRKDHITKILAFLIVSIHWFNPLAWIAFVLMSTDMELSCDERVLRVMNEDVKKPYANSLLSLAAGRHILNGSPLAFGEGNVKWRIKNVLNYRKPGFWVIFFLIIIVAAVAIGLVANPKSAASFNGSSYRVKEILYEAPMYSFSYTLDTAPQYSISSDYNLYSKEITDEDWIMHGRLYSCEISRQELSALFRSPSDNVREAINKAKLIYRADKEDDIKTFYLVMQLKDGDVLFALGYDNDETRHIRWLFRLEKISDFNGEVADRNSNANNISNDDQNAGSTHEFINNNEELLKEKNENEIAKLVEKNLAIIMSSPKEASNSYVYIQEHEEEYENIKKLGGEEALQYMLSQFKSGNAEGLRGHIMMQLCKELLGMRNNVTDETLTPQDWYDALSIRQEVKSEDLNSAQKYKEEIKIEFDTDVKSGNKTIIIEPSQTIKASPDFIEQTRQIKEKLLKPATGLFATVLDITPNDEDIKLDFSLRNISGKSLEFYFSSSKKFDIFITDNNGMEVYRWSHDKDFATAIINTKLKKDEKLSFSEVWDYKDNKGNRVLPGKYTIMVKILAKFENTKITNPDELTAAKDIEIK